MRTNDMDLVSQQQTSALTTQLAEMCEMAAHAIKLATQALLQADPALAQGVLVRQEAIATVSAHAKRAALLLPAWQGRSGAATTDTY